MVRGPPAFPEGLLEMLEMRSRAHPRTTEYVGMGPPEGSVPPLNFEKCCVITLFVRKENGNDPSVHHTPWLLYISENYPAV